MPDSEKPLLNLNLGNLDLSLTVPSAWTLLASLLLILLLLLARRRNELAPRTRGQVLLEMALEFVERQLVIPAHLEGRRWTPFIFTLFTFILINNLMGILPGAHPATANINETGALALMVFLVGIFLQLKMHGIAGFFRSLAPEGVRGPILLLLMPIELISRLVKPFSLAIRLFANMTGGHLLLLTILGFTVLFHNPAVSVVSAGGAVVILLFEIFVGFIQAYIFAFLSALFIGECLESTGGPEKPITGKTERSTDV